jgi:hypothetical protein
MDVIILFLWSVAVHAFTGAYIRVVGFDDEGFHPDQFPLPKRFERGAVRGFFSLSGGNNFWSWVGAGDVGLPFSPHELSTGWLTGGALKAVLRRLDR